MRYIIVDSNLSCSTGTALLNVMNDNWEQVCKEFGKPLMDSVSKKILKNVNKFLSHSPLEEITLTYI